MMRTVGKTLKWMFVLLAAATVAGAGYAYYLWSESDELLAGTLRARLREIAPDWNLDFKHIRFDWQGRIRIRDLSLKAADGHSPLLDVGEVVLTVDRERLADPQPPITLVHWSKARLHAVREADGQWNFQKLSLPHLDKNALPEFHLEHSIIFVDFRESAKQDPATLQIENVQLRLIPRGARQFLVRASAKLPGSEGVTAEGNWQVDEGAWGVSGQIKNLVLDGALSQLVARASADCRRGLDRLDALLAESMTGGQSTPRTSVGAGGGGTGGQPSAGSDDPISRLGFRAAADVQFRLAQGGPAADREYQVSVHLLQGALANPPAPFPLTDLRGQIDFDNRQIRFHELTAQSGPVHFHVQQGNVTEQGDSRPADFDLKITGLPLDERLPGLLPESIRRIYLELQPAGEADLEARIEFDGHDRWSHDCDLFVRNASASHQKFPYRVDQIQGTLKKRANLVDVSMQGRAGMQKVVITGKVRNPGPEAESRFVVATAGIPIDDRLRTACPEKFRNVIDQLQAEGDLEGKVTFYKPPGAGQILGIGVEASVSDGVINCRHFPYALSGVSGRFKGSGETWEFENFTGRHGAAEVVLNGDFRRNKAGRLRLLVDFSMEGGAFDRKLHDALPKSAQIVWQELNPDGGLNVSGRAYWWPERGGQFQLARCDAELVDARLTLDSFPYPINDVTAHIHYDGSEALISRFSGRHDETMMRFDLGTAEFAGDGEWCVRLERLNVDDLEATPQFRRALPGKLADIVNALNPRGKQSISGMIEFRGKAGGEYPVTAAWETETVYSGTTLNAGVELRDVRGKALFRGTWDGQEAIGEGQIMFNSAKVFKYQLTHVEGPVSLRGSRLILGAEPPEGPMRIADPNPSRRISARFIEGRVMLDAIVQLGDPMRYRVLMTLKDGSLKHYAQMYMTGNNRLAGRMNGSVDLRGDGTNPRSLRGEGNLVISQAALYELPMIAQIFNVLSFTPPDKAAFNNARFAFQIGSGRVRFDRIDLEGDAINLVGNGTVDFDGAVRMGFASRMGRKTLPIPLMHQVLNVMTQGWVGVDVRGTLQDQKYEVKSLPQVDDALRRLFDPRQSRR
ncbi:MAG: hypothetical protein HY290_30615 [Planctomycetia bacterium]|nr:hypothetical protein [Planctomycetia bacterium]